MTLELYPSSVHDAFQGVEIPYSPHVVKCAQQIHEACKGSSFDQETLLSDLGSQSLETRHVIALCYKELYCQSLKSAFQKNETSDEALVHLLRLLATPLPELEAQILSAATKDTKGAPATLLMQVIAGRTNEEMSILKNVYYDLAGQDVAVTMDSELSGDFRKVVLARLQAPQVPYNPAVHTAAKAEEEAVALYKAGQGRLGTNEEVFVGILVKAPPEFLKMMDTVYMGQYRNDIAKAVDKEFSGDAKRSLKYLVQCTMNPYPAIAEVFEQALKACGTDKTGLSTTLVRYQSVLPYVKAAYKKLYRKELRDRISEETSGDYKKLVLGVFDAPRDNSKTKMKGSSWSALSGGLSGRTLTSINSSESMRHISSSTSLRLSSKDHGASFGTTLTEQKASGKSQSSLDQCVAYDTAPHQGPHHLPSSQSSRLSSQTITSEPRVQLQHQSIRPHVKMPGLTQTSGDPFSQQLLLHLPQQEQKGQRQVQRGYHQQQDEEQEKQDEEQEQREEQQMRQRQEEELIRQRAEEEQILQRQEEEQQQRAEKELLHQQEEEQRQREEVELQQRQEEEQMRQRAEKEQLLQRQKEEQQQREEEEQMRQRAKKELLQRQEEEQRQGDAEELRLRQKEEKRQRDEEELRQRQAEELRQRQEEEQRQRDEEELRQRQEAELRQRQAEELRQRQEEELRQRQEEEQRQRDEEELRQRQAEELRQRQEQEQRQRDKEELRQRQEEEQRQRNKEELWQRQAEEQRKRDEEKLQQRRQEEKRQRQQEHQRKRQEEDRQQEQLRQRLEEKRRQKQQRMEEEQRKRDEAQQQLLQQRSGTVPSRQQEVGHSMQHLQQQDYSQSLSYAQQLQQPGLPPQQQPYQTGYPQVPQQSINPLQHQPSYPPQQHQSSYPQPSTPGYTSQQRPRLPLQQPIYPSQRQQIYPSLHSIYPQQQQSTYPPQQQPSYSLPRSSYVSQDSYTSSQRSNYPSSQHGYSSPQLPAYPQAQHSGYQPSQAYPQYPPTGQQPLNQSYQQFSAPVPSGYQGPHGVTPSYPMPPGGNYAQGGYPNSGERQVQYPVPGGYPPHGGV